jgi:hypothetical protein
VKVLTVKSVDVLDEEMQNEVHYSFGMEHYTDYVFKPRGAQRYSATIVLQDSKQVIENIRSASALFPGHEFVVDDLDMAQNCIDRYRLKEGEIAGHQRSGWAWEE